jgi:hypothetical protein
MKTLDPFSPERFERFFAKVEAAPAPSGWEHLGDCWLWTAVLNAEGYGCFYCPGFPGFNGEPLKGNRVLAHRWATAFWYGPEILRKLTYDHLCRRTACVSPRHGSAISRPANTIRGNQLRHVSIYDDPLVF